MKKFFQPMMLLTLFVVGCSLCAEAQLASDKVSSIAARRNRKSLVITRTIVHEPLTLSGSARLSSNLVSPEYIKSRLPVSMPSGTTSTRQMLRASQPVELPSNSPTLAQKGLIQRKQVLPAVY